MPDLTLKQHDTYPPLVAELKDSGGAPIDLTTAASVKLILKSTAVTITGACTITDAPNGVVSYAWHTGDTGTATDYQGEFEITWAGGGVETVPNDSYFDVLIKEDLG